MTPRPSSLPLRGVSEAFEVYEVRERETADAA
jgi:hypothetical protein